MGSETAAWTPEKEALPALSVMQPWAWLLININPDTGKAWKDVENRNWRKTYPRNCLIHAGVSFDKDGYEWIRRTFPEIPLPRPEEFERGGVVGRVAFTDCVSKMESRWFFGRYGYTTEGKGEPLPFRRCKGELGFFKPKYDATLPDPKPLTRPKAPREAKPANEAKSPEKTPTTDPQQTLPGLT